MMSTVTVHCQWESATVRERTGHQTSYAEAKKMKLLTLQILGCPGVSLRYCSSTLDDTHKHHHPRRTVFTIWITNQSPTLASAANNSPQE